MRTANLRWKIWAAAGKLKLLLRREPVHFAVACGIPVFRKSRISGGDLLGAEVKEHLYAKME